MANFATTVAVSGAGGVNQAVSLYDLITGAATLPAGLAASQLYAGISPSVREITIQADPGNGAATVIVGDKNLSATKYAVKLSSTAIPYQTRSNVNSLSLKNTFVMLDTNPSKVNINVDVL
jgi:hypothetical protein